MKNMQNKIIHCKCCEAELPRDIIALNKKLFEAETKRDSYFCLECMANFLECSQHDLIDKIEQFKSEGCKLYQ